MIRFAVLFLGLCGILSAQVQSGIARRIQWGANLPATCSPSTGDVFFRTAVSIGIHYCSAPNVWTIVSQTPGTGIAAINADSTTNQAFTTGTTGTDFNIAHPGGGSHVWNLPVASGTNTGKLSAADWTTFNAKESALTFSAPLSRAVNTISIPVATGAANGYLASADWTTFNNKLDPAGSYADPAWITSLSAAKITLGTLPIAAYVSGTPANGDCMKYETASGKLISSGAACGGSQTMSNAGTGSIGIYDSLVAGDFKLRNLNLLSSRLTGSVNLGNKNIDLDVNPDLDITTLAVGDGSLAGYVDLYPPLEATNSAGFEAPANRATKLRYVLPTTDTAGLLYTAAAAGNKATLSTLVLDTDTNLAADSDTRIPSQKAVKAYVDASGGGGSPVTVKAYHTASFGVWPQNSYTPVPFDTEAWDTANLHSTVTNNTRFIAPQNGYYTFRCQMQMDGVNSTTSLSIRLDGTTTVAIQQEWAPGYAVRQIAVHLAMNANQYLECLAYTDSAALTPSNGQYASWATFQRDF